MGGLREGECRHLSSRRAYWNMSELLNLEADEVDEFPIVIEYSQSVFRVIFRLHSVLNMAEQTLVILKI